MDFLWNGEDDICCVVEEVLRYFSRDLICVCEVIFCFFELK